MAFDKWIVLGDGTFMKWKDVYYVFSTNEYLEGKDKFYSNLVCKDGMRYQFLVFPDEYNIDINGQEEIRPFTEEDAETMHQIAIEYIEKTKDVVTYLSVISEYEVFERFIKQKEGSGY